MERIDAWRGEMLRRENLGKGNSGAAPVGCAMARFDTIRPCTDRRAQLVITRQHHKGDVFSIAVYSDCERYRYLLTREWQPGAHRALFVMLNPSTATEFQNDPTVERCERRARALGFGAFRVVNIFAYRATDPKVMRSTEDPIGAGNDAAIIESLEWADQVICAWGGHGAFLGRARFVEQLLRSVDKPLFHLGLTRDGQPKHPLYIGYAEQPRPWVL